MSSDKPDQMELSLGDNSSPKPKNSHESKDSLEPNKSQTIGSNKTASLVLTPNASLAQQLRRRRLLAEDNHLLGSLSLLGNLSSSAVAADIHVLQSWLVSSVQPEHPLATDHQLQFLWEQVITEQKDKNQDFQQLNPGYLAGQALTAWKSLKQWQISFDELAKAETGQLLSFRSWVVEFEKRLSAKKLSTLELEIELGLKSGQAANQQREPLVLTYAFIDPLPPLWQQWLAHKFETIEEVAYSSDLQGDTQGNAQGDKSARLCALESDEQELDAALSWAKSINQAEEQARIAIIDTDLKDNLKTITRKTDSLIEHSSVIRFSREPLLSDEGSVLTALALLALNESQITLAKARQIIQSPLWGGRLCDDTWGKEQDEYKTRASWDFNLCALQADLINTSDFISLVKPAAADDEPGNDAIARLALTFAEKRRHKQLKPLQWCDLFQSQLRELGCLEQFTDAQWQRWNDALSDFARLGSVTGNISITEALRLLEGCCSASSAKSASAGPGITFLDTVEAAADYTHIWILGMDNLSWPGMTRFNPLLPVSLQTQRQMPRSNPQMETDLVRRLIERLMQAADQVVFSYSRFNDDLEQSPCAFIAGLAEYKPFQGSEKSHEQGSQPAMEWVDCSTAPKVPEAQRDVRGGASLLKTMAASPFDAFCQWRLGAYDLDEPQIGLSALDRGNLVHNVLEQVWRQLGNSEALHKLDQVATVELCKAAADKELKRFQARNGWLKQGFAELEVKRLAALVRDWLDFERERSEFNVELTEEKLSANIAGLTFKMRLDRLDRLPGGELILIDYKTGQSLSRKYWLESPPVEPQLPLYALTLGSQPTTQQPNALCFAKVRADKMEFIGIGNESVDGLKGFEVQENWPELISEWKCSLEALATDFINGDTRAFETVSGFSQSDPFAPLHRFAEFDELEGLKARLVESGAMD